MLAVILIQSLLIAVIALWAARRQIKEVPPATDLGTMLDGKIGGLQSAVDRQMDAQNQRLFTHLDQTGDRLDRSLLQTATMMKTIGEELQAVRDSAGQLLEVGREINGLNAILAAPGARGAFGEMLLERLLQDVLPADSFEVQHRFRSGKVVDAIVRVGERFVPIDAKFPLEGFRRILDAETDNERTRRRRDWLRSVRTHVDAVSQYIQPDEGSFEFALLYVPAENVYAECLTAVADGSRALQEYALEKRVIITSPNTLFAYLQAIVVGLRGFTVERQARRILDHLGALSREFGEYRREVDVLGTHLTRARAKYEDIAGRADRLGERLDRAIEPIGDPEALSGVA